MDSTHVQICKHKTAHTRRKIQTHDAVVGSQKSRVHGKVGRRSRVRLHIHAPLVGVQTVSLEGTSLAQNLNLVNVLVATVVTLARVALSVLVGESRAKALHHSLGGQVLTGNQLEARPLSVFLLLDDIEQLGVVHLERILTRKESGDGGHARTKDWGG